MYSTLSFLQFLRKLMLQLRFFNTWKKSTARGASFFKSIIGISRNKFGELTGVPVLLNTSFNIQEPIVNSPTDAIKTFLNSDVDVLSIESFICDESWRKKING